MEKGRGIGDCFRAFLPPQSPSPFCACHAGYIHENQGPRFERNYFIAKKEKAKLLMNMALHFKPLMLITRLICIQCKSDTSRFLSPVSTVSAGNARDHDSPYGAHTSKKKERNAFIFRVSLLKQARLITIPYLGVHTLDFSSQNNLYETLLDTYIFIGVLCPFE